MLALLNGADGAGFVEVTLVVYVELTKGILEAKDGALVELGIFPAAREIQLSSGLAGWGGRDGGRGLSLPLQLDYVHGFNVSLVGCEGRAVANVGLCLFYTHPSLVPRSGGRRVL